eukprot:m.144085 g.144085  ORF g.144085 m.144085 type:complete len:175 (+) comp14910_c0_seq9:71-595(+)
MSGDVDVDGYVVAHMQAALKQAQLALDESEVPVGCVIVHPSKGIVAQGRNRTNVSKNATRHAELEAYDKLLTSTDKETAREILKQSSLYVTVEPCVMCSHSLRLIDINKVYFGCRNDRFGGCGSVLSLHEDPNLQDHGSHFQISEGHEKDEAIKLLQAFYAQENPSAPCPKRKP